MKKLAIMALLAAAPSLASAQTAAAPSVAIELNKAEPDQGSCQFYFVVKSDNAYDEFKIEFIVFGTDGGITHRIVADLGPVKAQRTSVKVFKTADACDGVSGLLVNDVKSCGASQKADECMALIKPSSRAPIKLFM